MNRIILIALVLVGCADKSKFDPKAYAGKAEATGRYQLMQLGEVRADQYLLDTASGRLWEPVCTKLAKNGIGCEGDTVFIPVTVQGLPYGTKD